MSSDDSSASDGTLGRIALKQVRMTRAEAEARRQPASKPGTKVPKPVNRLVPYLDLFSRLSDDELSRLAHTPVPTVESLRQQVEEVGRGLGRYVDLLPRLSDDELVRLTGASPKTIRFWRLSQPRHLQGQAGRVDPGASGSGHRVSTASPVTGSGLEPEAAPTDHAASSSGSMAVDWGAEIEVEDSGSMVVEGL